MSIFDAPILPSESSEEKITYSIWLGKYGEKLKEIKWSDSWNVISRYWDIVKNKLKKSNPIKDGYVLAQLRIWRTPGYVFECKSNRKGYLLQISKHYTITPEMMPIGNHIMELFVTKSKIAHHYAKKFEHMGNKVEIFKCQSAKFNSWIKVATYTPFLKSQGGLIVKPITALIFIPGRTYSTNY